MAYKKYIKRNGKLYGPYLYESKRVDGRVVSEYHGSEEPKKSKGVQVRDYRKTLFIFLGVFIFVGLIYFLVTVPNYNGFSGKAVLDIESFYVDGEPLEGILKFSFKEGEFIPASSKVIFEGSNENYSFILSDILKEDSLEGNYYVEGKSFSGEGLGYGKEGEVKVYPEVSFILQIYKELPEEENLEEENTELIEDDTNVNLDEVNQDETTEEDTSVPITGGVIKNSGGFLTSLFNPTGMVSLELQDEIQGETSANESFTYLLNEGERVEIKPKSVFVGDEEVSDNTITLEILDGEAIITTDYSVVKKGYGEEYLGDKDKVFSLDLSDLNLTFKEGDLNVKLVYEEEEMIHLSTSLKEGEDALEEIIDEETDEESDIVEDIVEIPKELESPEDIVLENETVDEITNSSVWDIGSFLTSEERAILKSNFGEIELKTVKSELFKDRIIVAYDFGGYNVEYSYDSSTDKDVLDIYMEKDRIKFLKDIAASVSKEETSSTKLEILNESYLP